jgi:hypothetical protein
LGAIDRRVKCIVSQVPLISGHALARRLVRSDFLVGLHRMFEDDRRARYDGKPPAMIPVVSENPAGPAALPTPDSWTFFTETARKRAPAWKNEVTLRSVEMFTEYEPGSYIAHISPTPLMLVVWIISLSPITHWKPTSVPSRRRNLSPWMLAISMLTKRASIRHPRRLWTGSEPTLQIELDWQGGLQGIPERRRYLLLSR